MLYKLLDKLPDSVKQIMGVLWLLAPVFIMLALLYGAYLCFVWEYWLPLGIFVILAIFMAVVAHGILTFKM
jgi:fatty acid desaturase